MTSEGSRYCLIDLTNEDKRHGGRGRGTKGMKG